MNHGPAGGPHTGGDPDSLDGRAHSGPAQRDAALVALLINLVVACRKPYYMDAVLILFSLAFSGRLASAHYHGEWKILVVPTILL